MEFKKWFSDQEGYPQLHYLLGDPGTLPQIGDETGSPVANGIARYDSPHGSHRYVYYLNSQAVSALQVVSKDKRSGALVTNVYTHPDYRRQKLATQLLQQAQSDFRTVHHQDRSTRSKLGNQWFDSLPAD